MKTERKFFSKAMYHHDLNRGRARMYDFVHYKQSAGSSAHILYNSPIHVFHVPCSDSCSSP
jgi:hypothetical protein